MRKEAAGAGSQRPEMGPDYGAEAAIDTDKAAPNGGSGAGGKAWEALPADLDQRAGGAREEPEVPSRRSGGPVLGAANVHAARRGSATCGSGLTTNARSGATTSTKVLAAGAAGASGVSTAQAQLETANAAPCAVWCTALICSPAGQQHDFAGAISAQAFDCDPPGSSAQAKACAGVRTPVITSVRPTSQLSQSCLCRTAIMRYEPEAPETRPGYYIEYIPPRGNLQLRSSR